MICQTQLINADSGLWVHLELKASTRGGARLSKQREELPNFPCRIFARFAILDLATHLAKLHSKRVRRPCGLEALINTSDDEWSMLSPYRCELGFSEGFPSIAANPAGMGSTCHGRRRPDGARVMHQRTCLGGTEKDTLFRYTLHRGYQVFDFIRTKTRQAHQHGSLVTSDRRRLWMCEIQFLLNRKGTYICATITPFLSALRAKVTFREYTCSATI